MQTHGREASHDGPPRRRQLQMSFHGRNGMIFSRGSPLDDNPPLPCPALPPGCPLTAGRTGQALILRRTMTAAASICVVLFPRDSTRQHETPVLVLAAAMRRASAARHNHRFPTSHHYHIPIPWWPGLNPATSQTPAGRQARATVMRAVGLETGQMHGKSHRKRFSFTWAPGRCNSTHTHTHTPHASDIGHAGFCFPVPYVYRPPSLNPRPKRLRRGGV